MGKYIRGYVRIRLESPAPERFFSLCVHNRIPLRNLTQEGSCYEMELSAGIFCVLAVFAGKQMPGSTFYEKTVCLSFYTVRKKERLFFSEYFLGWCC